MGLALSTLLPGRRKVKGRGSSRGGSVLSLLSWNAAAFAALAAILMAGTENGGLARQWTYWWPVSSAAMVAGLLVGRFPLSSLGTLVVLGGALAALVAGVLRPFHPFAEGEPLKTVQPITLAELAPAFGGQVDLLTLPALFQGEPTLWYRLRPSSSSPPEVWWNEAGKLGWAQTVVLSPPESAQVLDVYQLELVLGRPQWKSKLASWGLPDTP